MQEAQRSDRPGLIIFTDGSRPVENGAIGYAVIWKKADTWKGHRTHMGWGQEAYDAECVTIARGIVSSSNQKPHARNPGRHPKGDLRRPGARPENRDHGQKAYCHLPHQGTNVTMEIRWRPRRQGIEGNEIADEAKLAGDDPNHGWNGSASRTHTAKSGREASPSRDPWPTSSANSRKRSGQEHKIGRRRGSARR